MAIRFDKFGNPLTWCAEKPKKPLEHPPKGGMIIYNPPQEQNK